MSKKVFTTYLCILLMAAFGIAQAENWDQSGGQQPPQQATDGMNGQMDGQTDGQTQDAMTTPQSAQGQSNMTQLEPLIGKTVLDAQQKEIGEIQDVVVDQQHQKASYVIIGAGGFLGIGEDYHAVPWSALKVQSVGDTVQSVTTSLDSQTISSSPTIEMGTARSFDSRLKSQVDSYYQGKGVSIQSNGMGATNGTNGTSGQPDAMQDYQQQQKDVDIIPRQTNGTNGTTDQDVQIIPRESNGTYGDGVRSGEPQTGSSTETDQSDTVAPFGAQPDGQTNGASPQNGVDSSMSTRDTATDYRSGYAEGPTRLPEGTEAKPQANGSIQTNGASQNFVWFSDLNGKQVVSQAQDQQVGQLSDLVVDARQGDISFGLIELDQGTVAVPWSALQMRDQDTLVVSAQPETLRSLAFQSDSKPDFSDPAFQQNTYEQFGQQPPTVYGYVTPQQTADLESEYTRQYDSQKTETVSGKIQQLMKEQKDQSGQMQQSQMQSQKQHKAMEFTLQTDQGQTLKVHAAPEQFLKDRGLELSEGDTVRVTGSKAQIKGEQVLIASKISKDQQEVMIRSAQGQPMWTSGQSGSQMQSERQRQTNGMNGQTDSQLQKDQSQSGDGLIDSQMNGQTNGQSDHMKSDQEQKDQWKSDGTNGTNGAAGAAGSEAQSGLLQFRSDEQTTINGTVQSTDSGRPGAMTAMDQAVLMQIQTDQGQTQTVYAGPRDFIQKKNMSFNNGDQVTVTGWKKTIAGQEVFIASKIEKDGQVLQLRDMQGNPEWKTEGSSLQNGTDSQQDSSQTDRSNSDLNSTY